MNPVHAVTWTIVPPDDDDAAHHRVEIEGEAYGVEGFYKATCKYDGCTDMWWGQGDNAEYEHICDLRDKIMVLVSLFNTAYDEWQKRGGGEGCWLDPVEAAKWSARMEQAKLMLAAQKSGIILP